jgi:hypothetical protein
MQAKVTGMAIDVKGKRTITLKFGVAEEWDKDEVYMPKVTLPEDEISLIGLTLGDMLEVDFAPARSTQAAIDTAISRQDINDFPSF